MTVTGATTARIASVTYVPPFQFVSTNPAAVQVTGSVTSAISIDPTVTAGTSDADYAWAYLQAHMMSSPSYRYAYVLWMALALMAVIYGAAHHLRLSGGSFGAWLGKYGMRRHTIGSKRPGARNRALPSDNVMLTIAIITALTLVLCLVGADYVVPTSSILDFSKSFKRAISSSPNYTIQKSLWTLGSRFGYMAFALVPVVVLLALKSRPFALVTLVTNLHSDKLAMLHRAVAWLVWAITTAHVALWTVQLFQDSRGGQATWFYLWTNYRFIFGCIAYLAMTALMVFSLRPIRKNRYELFYFVHVSLVILTLAACAIHHPVLWYWMAGAAGIWALERCWRFTRFARINATFSGRPAPQSSYAHVATDEFGLQDNPAHKPEFGVRLNSAYYDEGSLQPLGSYEARYADPYAPAPLPPLTHSFVAPSVPPGFAHAQLLPSRTVRLTIKLPRPFRWSPGQSCLLYLPDFSRLQSHPFTIVNNNNESELVILVKSRKGLTRRLYDHVRDRSLSAIGMRAEKDQRMSLASMRGAGKAGMQVAPVHVRTWVDGPFGSATKVRWDDYSTIIIVCGGSGVSFGAAVCDYACQAMAKNIESSKIRRVRFCWVVREYAEIAWVAGQLYRCQQMVSDAQIEINIFVTNANTKHDEFAPPQPGFARYGRRDSAESMSSELSTDEPLVSASYEDDDVTPYADVIDLTNYDDEEDVNDPAEQQLSDKLQEQGKLRRARSRKAARGTKQPSMSYPPGPSAPTLPNAPRPEPRLDLHRQSYRSIADSTYGLYDPYGGMRGLSPSPSIQFDDNYSTDGTSVRNLLSRASRTGSMVLLEDNSGDSDDALWVDQADHAAMNVMSEMARPGKPRLSAVLEEEMARAGGKTIVATCGPVTLNAVVRNLVSKNISMARMRHGNRSGHVAIYSEDYES